MIFPQKNMEEVENNIRNKGETNQDGLEEYREEAIFQEGVDCSQTTQMLQAPYINFEDNKVY